MTKDNSVSLIPATSRNFHQVVRLGKSLHLSLSLHASSHAPFHAFFHHFSPSSILTLNFSVTGGFPFPLNCATVHSLRKLTVLHFSACPKHLKVLCLTHSAPPQFISSAFLFSFCLVIPYVPLKYLIPTWFLDLCDSFHVHILFAVP